MLVCEWRVGPERVHGEECTVRRCKGKNGRDEHLKGERETHVLPPPPSRVSAPL